MEKPNSIYTDKRLEINLNVGGNGVVANMRHDGRRGDPMLFEFRENESDADNKKRVIDETEKAIAVLENQISEFRTQRNAFLEDAVAFFRHEEEETTEE